MKRRHVAQEVAPRMSPGIDHGSEGKVLVRYGETLLVWQKPCKVWSGIGRDRSYVPAHLEVRGYITEYGRPDRMGKNIAQGGRLTAKVIAAHIDEIRRLMKLPKLKAVDIDLNKTLVIE